MHWNPSVRLITRASVPRNWSLSSTMETVIAMVRSAVAQRDNQAYQSAASGCGTDGKTPAQVFQPFAHVAQTTSGLRRRFAQTRYTAAVVLNLQGETRGRQLEPQINFGRLCMPDHVGDGFLGREEDIVPHLRRNRRG